MTEQDVVFGNTVDGLFHKRLGARITPALRQQLKAEGLDLDAPLQSAYPRVRYFHFVQLAADALFPGTSRDAALEELGRQFMHGYAETLVGRAALAMGRLLGPRRMLARMGHNMRTSNNYLQVRFSEHGPADVELWLSETSGVPSYFRGVLAAGTELCGGHDVQVAVAGGEGRAASFRVRWREGRAAA